MTANPSVPTGHQQLLFPGEVTPRWTYVIYDDVFAGLEQSPNNIITAWYSNYQQNGNNHSSIQFNVLVSGAPSAPGAPTFGPQISDASGILVDATSSPPQYNDASGGIPPPGPPGIKAYKMTVSSNGDSTYRYNSAVPYDVNQFIAETTSGIVTLSQLYPDSSYNVYAQAQNTSFAGYGPTGPVGVLSATHLPMPTNSGIFGYTGPTYTAKLVASNASGDSANASVSPILFASPAPWTSTSVTNSIQAVSNRGKLGTTSIFDVSGNVVRPAGVSAALSQVASLSYNGFPISTPSPASATGYITINPTTPVDAYAASQVALQGYYLTTSNSATISSSVFVISNDKTTTTLTTRQKATGGETIESGYYFYYDAYTTPPVLNSVTIGLRNTITSTQISGIYIVYGPVNLSCNTNVSNIGTYFYNNDQILEYSSGQSETNTSNVTSSLSGSKFNNPVTFVNSTTVQNPAATMFTTSSIIAVSAYGPTTVISTDMSSNSIPMILDPLSYDLVSGSTAGYPSSVATIGLNTGTIYGFRVSSGAAITSPAPPPYITQLPPASSIATTPYDNSANLTANQDLQLTNGQYQTKGTGAGTGYKNYTPYYYGPSQLNTLNYSGITNTGYRYSTFSFKVATNTSPFVFVQFKVNGISQTITFQNSDVTRPAVGSTRLYFYYRVEDADNFSSFDLTHVNTNWLDAINTVPPELNQSNYYNLDYPAVSAGNANTPNTFIGGTYTINCLSIPINVTLSDNYYVYFRVCAPMNEDFWFSNVSAQFT